MVEPGPGGRHAGRTIPNRPGEARYAPAMSRLRLTVGGRIARIRGSFEPVPVYKAQGRAGVSTRGEHQVR